MMFVAKEGGFWTTARRRGAVSSGKLLAILILVAFVLVPAFASNFAVFQLTLVLIYGMAIMGLMILTGGTGQISLGHSAFFAIGAYTAAFLLTYGGVPCLLTIPMAGAVSFIVGFLFGFPALRLQRAYLAMATFSLAVVMPMILKVNALEEWTGGVQGLFLTIPEAPLGLPLSRDVWLYYVVLIIGGLIYLGATNLLASRTGRSMLAIRDNQTAAAAAGINVAWYKTLAFGISAGITGIAGGLGAIVVQYVSPDSYTLHFSIALFLGMVVGGVGWLPGSLVGAAFVVFVPNFAEEISKGLSEGVFGVLLFAVIFLLPGGSQQLARLLGCEVGQRLGWNSSRGAEAALNRSAGTSTKP